MVSFLAISFWPKTVDYSKAFCVHPHNFSLEGATRLNVVFTRHNANHTCGDSYPDAAGPLEGAKKEGCSEDREVACRRHLKHSFSTLLRKMWSGRFSAVLPRSFKTTLGLLRPQFNGSRQVRRGGGGLHSL